MYIDTQKLNQAVSNYKLYSRPSDGTGSNPCTINDINKVVDNTTKILRAFIEELEAMNNQ